MTNYLSMLDPDVQIVAHPNNVAFLKEELSNIPHGPQLLRGIRIIESEFLEEFDFDLDQASFKFDGSDEWVPRSKVELKTRFVTYGPEDVRYLEYCGVLKIQYRRLFYTMRIPKNEWIPYISGIIPHKFNYRRSPPILFTE